MDKFTDEDIDKIFKANIGITPFGIVLSETDYDKLLKGKENLLYGLILNDYILIKHVGFFNFIHYGPPDLTSINPSIDDNFSNLSFGSGIYCFNADTHTICDTVNKIAYIGKYIGEYLECIYDCDSGDKYDKGYGNTKEYVLLTSTPIKVDAINI